MPGSHDTPESHIPLRPVELLLLTMLTSGNRHGYGHRQDILDHTGGKIELEAGTLYRHIRRLEEAKLLAQATASDDEDERRILYRWTLYGKKVLPTALVRYRSLIRLAATRRIISPARSIQTMARSGMEPCSTSIRSLFG